MIIAVGSKNPTKTNSVKNVFSKHFKSVKVIGVAAASGVSDQPMSDNETYQGALNRAKYAIENVKNAEFGVGIEGGLQKHSYGWFERSIVVIVGKSGEIGVGSSGGLVLSEKIMKGIHSGKNLNDVMDEMFGTNEIGRGIGMFGIMTKGSVDRTSGVEHGVAFALARFHHKDLYEK